MPNVGRQEGGTKSFARQPARRGPTCRLTHIYIFAGRKIQHNAVPERLHQRADRELTTSIRHVRFARRDIIFLFRHGTDCPVTVDLTARRAAISPRARSQSSSNAQFVIIERFAVMTASHDQHSAPISS
jgi:hypothetical protein